MADNMKRILEVKDLSISFSTSGGELNAIRGVGFELHQGETLAIVGESGSGKSVTVKSIMGIMSENQKVNSGEINFTFEENGKEVTRNLLTYSKKRIINEICGQKIAMVFQDPMTALNPVMTIGKQIMEGLRKHRGMSKKDAFERGVELLEQVGIPRARECMKEYPHQLSGGMRQRVMIAMALCCNPKLLIADEPTTALDVTIQAQVLRLMNDLKKEFGTSILFITHDLGVINQMADYVAVMYCGQVVERVPAKVLFDPKTEYSHPYTEGLMVSIPRLDTPANQRLEAIPGAVPHPLDLPKGCKFSPRCKYCTEKCREAEPPMTRISDTQEIRCFYPNKEVRKNGIK